MISPQARIRELADLFYSKGEGCAAVVSREGDFVGEVGVLDLLRAALPHYTDKVQSLSLLGLRAAALFHRRIKYPK
jgi:CBS domain-containing protein